MAPPEPPALPAKPYIAVPKQPQPGSVEIYIGIGLGCLGLIALPIIGLIAMFNSILASIMIGLIFGGAALLFAVGIVTNCRASSRINQQQQIAAAQWQQTQQMALTQWEQQCSMQQARWEQAMLNWDSLFYCSRCDHVYNPVTGEAAPSEAMQFIL